MRRLVPVVLIAVLLSQPFGMTWVYLLFRINQAYIAKNLCVQKDVKGNKCQGCCHLKKKLHETEKQESTNLPPAAKLKAEFNLFESGSAGSVNKPPCITKITDYHTFTGIRPSKRYLSGIFHPPEPRVTGCCC